MTPAPKGTTLGNRITANRWAKILRQLGHQVDVSVQFDGTDRADLLIALHATRSHESVSKWKSIAPRLPLIVCLTGTDLHIDLQENPHSASYRKAESSLQLADHIILLEPEGIHGIENSELRESVLTKSSVIFQSACPVDSKPEPLHSCLEVSVIGHLREVKDPFRTAIAASLLPSDSKIKIVHLGGALSPEMEQQALKMQDANDRYQWLGSRPHAETMNRLAQSQLTVLTSQVEGAPGVISEAIVNQIPVLATRIPATLGLLGENYPGLFPFGETETLSRLLYQFERDSGFREELNHHIKKLRPHFIMEAEVFSWDQLLKSRFSN